MTNQQKGFVLIGLFVAWGGMMAYQMADDPESGGNNPSAPGAQAHSTLPSVHDLSLEATFPNSRQTVTFTQPRNIFAPFGSPRMVAKQERPKASQPSPVIATPPPAPPGPSPGELAAQRARQQLNQFRFLGYLTKGGVSQAFITNGQAIYIVKQGEMLEGQVQVNKIEPETIVLSTKIWETGNQVQATIPLTPETHS
jgi:Tfp pilus assembly protein PilP